VMTTSVGLVDSLVTNSRFPVVVYISRPLVCYQEMPAPLCVASHHASESPDSEAHSCVTDEQDGEDCVVTH